MVLELDRILVTSDDADFNYPGDKDLPQSVKEPVTARDAALAM
jgi:hypothetical protein